MGKKSLGKVNKLNCPECSAEVPEGTKYRPKCGESLPTVEFIEEPEDAQENQENNCIITGDFNSCGIADTMNLTYSEKVLNQLLNFNWVDSWAAYKNNDQERYTWFSTVKNGFRLDYVFLSPKLGEQIDKIDIYHDSTVRKEGMSDHSSIIMEYSIRIS